MTTSKRKPYIESKPIEKKFPSTKPYIREFPLNWWMKNMVYTKYMIREGSSLVIVVYSLILLTGLLRLSQGALEWQGWLEALTSTGSIVFHVIALIWAFYHTLTWFALAPKASELFIGDQKLSDGKMMAMLWAGFVIVTAGVLFWVVL